MKNKKIIPLNIFGSETHKMTKGKSVYSSDLYQSIVQSLNHEYLPLENNAFLKYENILKFL